jgi:hypothetical protein
MNAQSSSLLVLSVALFAVLEARAANPRTHHLHGVVQSVDTNAHTLTVQKSSKDQPRVIQWGERTRLRDGKAQGKPENLKSGQAVCVYYRVLPGRLEATSVRVRRQGIAREKGSARGGASDLMGH